MRHWQLETDKDHPCLVLLVLIVSIFFANIAYAKLEMFAITGLEGSGWEVSPQWKRESGWLSYLKGNRFYIYNLETREPPKPLEKAGVEIRGQLSFVWSPTSENRWAALVREEGGKLGLYLGKGTAFGERLVEFPEGGEGVQFSKLSFSRNGREILYSNNGVLYKISVKRSAQPEPLLSNRITDGAQSWGVFNPAHPEVVAFQLEKDGRERIYIYNRKQLKIIGSVKGNFSACHPDWSPDGKGLAFFSNRTKAKSGSATPNSKVSWRLWYLSYNHLSQRVGPPKLISAEDYLRRKSLLSDFTSLSWSPDSQKIIYTAYGEENRNHLMVANLAGKRKKIYLGEKIAIESLRGYTTSWRLRIINSDIGSVCFEGNCYLAIAADIDLGRACSKIIILNSVDIWK